MKALFAQIIIIMNHYAITQLDANGMECLVFRMKHNVTGLIILYAMMLAYTLIPISQVTLIRMDSAEQTTQSAMD